MILMQHKMLMRNLLFILIGLYSFVCQAQPVSLSQVFAAQPFLPKSAIIPIPNSTLTQTQIMFDHPSVPKAIVYTLRVFEGKDKSAVEKVNVDDSSCATLVNGLEFGKSYKWQYFAMGKGNKVIFASPWYEFSILPLPNKNRIRVITYDSMSAAQGLISFDYHCMIFSRDGTPVWFLPNAVGREFSREDKVRDLRITFAGTCTFITQRNAFEIAPDGRILWKAPQVNPRSPNYVENLHHGVERMPNGNMMTMGNHTERYPAPNDTAIVKVEFGVIVEYDRKGAVVWKWDSFNYIQHADLEFKRLSTQQWNVSTHLNAFRVSPDGSVVYAGFRDLERIVMINRATAIDAESYGRLMPSGLAPKGNGFFHLQHDVCPLRDGNIAVFNNDSITNDSVVSSIVIFSRAKTGGDASVVWRFACNFDKLTNGKSEKGGSVDELANGNLLVNFGTLNRCIEITRDKKIVWDAFSEAQGADSTQWLAAGQYRSHFSSSLYPCYFSAVVGKLTKTELWVDITNDGTEGDSYKVSYQLGDNVWIASGTSIVVAPGKRLPFLVFSGKASKVTALQITSTSNSDFVRTIQVK